MNKCFIYSRRRAGLGDLLSGLYSSWEYAKKYDMDLIINWRDSIYLEDDINIFSTFFNDCIIDGVKITSDKVDISSLPKPIYCGGKEVDENNIRTTQEFRRRIYNLEPMSANTIESGQGVSLVFRKEKEKEISLKINFYKELANNYKKDITNKIDEKKSIIFNNNAKYLGIQIRNGNGFEAFYDYDQTIDFIENIEAFANKIVTIIKFIYKDYEVFLSTDSENVKKKLLEKLPSIKTLDLWYPKHGEEPQFAIKNNCPNPLESMINAFIDMNLLSNCDVICSAGVFKSTFATISSLLNGKTQHQTISPYSV